MVSEDSGSVSEIPHLSDLQASRLANALLTEVETAAEVDVPKLDGYLLERRIGEGGGGQVYLGVRTGSDRRVAVKFLRKRVDRELDARRVWRELELLERFRLPGLPHVYDHGMQDGHVFIVFEFIEGTPLDEYCRAAKCDRETTVELLIKTARHLHRLNERGVIHRDVKPANVLVTPSGEPVLIDLGVASLLSDDPEDSFGEEGSPIGSLAFMSPEQARGDGQAVTVRSDVFGLAAMACRLLTGSTPHDTKASLPEAIRRVAHDPPRDPRTLERSLPETLAKILSKGLSTDPNQRHASAAEFAEDLRKWREGEPIEWQAPGWIERQRLAWRRDPTRWLMKAAVWVLVFFGIGASAAATGLGSVAQRRDQIIREQEAVLVEKAGQVAEKETLIEDKLRELEVLRETAHATNAAATAVILGLASIEDELSDWNPEDGRYMELIATIRSLEPVTIGVDLPPMTDVLMDLLHAVYQSDDPGLQRQVELLRVQLQELERNRFDLKGQESPIDLDQRVKNLRELIQ